MYTPIACDVPNVKMDAIVNIDAELKQVSKAIREIASRILLENEFSRSASLVQMGNQTFLKTQYWRFFPSKLIDGAAYKQLEVLATSQDYGNLQRAFLSFIKINTTKSNSTAEVEADDTMMKACFTPLNETWSIKLHTSQLSSTDYTPLQLAADGFKAILSYMQDCSEIPKVCEYVHYALQG